LTLLTDRRRPPQARDRAIGAQLKAIRTQQTKLSLEAAAKRLQWSSATMSRIENGKRTITSEEVMAILVLYGVPVSQRDALVARAKSTNESGWWDRPLPGVPPEMGALASYEAEAVSLTNWTPMLIPGLLQTYDYARAFMLRARVAPADIETRWMARLRRQQVLPKLEYTAFIGEQALSLPFGGPGVLAAQLQHLLEAADRGTNLHIVPACAHAHLLHSWLLMEFRDTPPVLHVELNHSALYLHNREVEPYLYARSELRELSLSRAESRIMIKEMLNGGLAEKQLQRHRRDLRRGARVTG
jgi:transcriptional regulator with XRE-family HTH domain